MPLLKARLKEKIKEAFVAEQSEKVNHNDSLDRISDKLAAAIIEEIQLLKVNYITGLIAPSGGGPITGTITHTIS